MHTFTVREEKLNRYSHVYTHLNKARMINSHYRYWGMKLKCGSRAFWDVARLKLFSKQVWRIFEIVFLYRFNVALLRVLCIFCCCFFYPPAWVFWFADYDYESGVNRHHIPHKTSHLIPIQNTMKKAIQKESFKSWAVFRIGCVNRHIIYGTIDCFASSIFQEFIT